MASTDSETVNDWKSLHEQWWNLVMEGANRFVKGDWHFFGPESSSQFGATPDSGRDAAADRFVHALKQYLDWVEKLSSQLASGLSFPTDAEGWTRLLKTALGPLGETKNPFRGLFAAMAGVGARGIESWLSEWASPAEGLKAELRSLLGLPALGYTRETQERQQKLADAWLQYQDALAAYNRLMLQASRKALGEFESMLAAREREGRRLETLREVYDLWIDAAEAAYAEVAGSMEFRAAYGDLVNKQMLVRKLVQHEIEQFTGQFGIPTRTEVDSTARRVHELRRELRALRERLALLESANSAPQPVAPAGSGSVKRKAPAKSAAPRSR